MLADPIIRQEWHAVIRMADVPDDKPIAVDLLGNKVVVWKTAGKIYAWEDLCVHRGAKLSLGRVINGCLSCPYHGWLYNTDGQCVRIPAHPEQVPPRRAHTKTYACQERYELVWVSLMPSDTAIPDFPEWEQPAYRKVVRGPFLVHAQGPRLIENFLDVSHLSILHHGILGDEARAEIEPYKVVKTKQGVTASEINIWQPDGGGTGEPAMVQYTYEVSHPLAAYLTKQAGDIHLTIMLTATPVDEKDSLAWMLMAVRNADHVPESTLVDYADTIFMQDVPVVESQHPERLPLDLQTELHLNSDRTSIAYRQWLQELGLVYGTA